MSKASSTEALNYANDLTELHNLTKARINAYNSKIKDSVDTRRRSLTYQVGDMVMVRLRPERYAMEKAHKLHPPVVGPFPIRQVINPNAYDVHTPPEWGISSTVNISDLVAYQGPLHVPSEPGQPHSSTESSSSSPRENDGDHSTPRVEATNDPAIKMDSDVSVRPEPDTGAVETGDWRPRRLAKSTTKPSEYVYF